MTIEIRKVGIIGAGQMGNGIAHVCALAGYDVALNDLSEDRIHAGLATINGNISRQVSKGTVSEAERKAALDRIVPAADAERLAREAKGPVELMIVEDGNHIATNRAYRWRSQSADWMKEQLG